MPRIKPTRKIDELGRYDVHPAKDFAEYIVSKESDNLLMKPPAVGSVGDDIEAFYLEKKAEYNFLQRYLTQLHKEQSAQKRIFTNRVHILKQDFDKMNLSFYNLNNFIRDSDEKKKTAIKSINDEIEIQAALKDGIESKRAMNNELEIFRDQIKLTNLQYLPYETVVENAVKKSKTFESVKDMIDRCDAIMLVNAEITTLDAKLFADIESMHEKIASIVRKAEMIILGLKNVLNDMSRLYKESRTECLRWEATLAQAKTVALVNKNNKNRIIDGICGLYRLLCSRSKLSPKHQRLEIEKELDSIRDEVYLYREVLAEYYNRNNDKYVANTLPKCVPH